MFQYDIYVLYRVFSVYKAYLLILLLNDKSNRGRLKYEHLSDLSACACCMYFCLVCVSDFDFCVCSLLFSSDLRWYPLASAAVLSFLLPPPKPHCFPVV